MVGISESLQALRWWCAGAGAGGPWLHDPSFSAVHMFGLPPPPQHTHSNHNCLFWMRKILSCHTQVSTNYIVGSINLLGLNSSYSNHIFTWDMTPTKNVVWYQSLTHWVIKVMFCGFLIAWFFFSWPIKCVGVIRGQKGWGWVTYQNEMYSRCLCFHFLVSISAMTSSWGTLHDAYLSLLLHLGVQKPQLKAQGSCILQWTHWALWFLHLAC